MLSRSVKSALLCLCVSSAFICAAPAYAAGAQDAGTVSVSGYAEEQITPDTAYITIGMTTDGKTSEEARMKNNAVINEVQQAALAMGIEKKDMKTRGYNVYPTYGSNQKITGYSVSNNLELKVSDFDLIPRLIARASQVGANEVHGVRFTNEHADTLRSNLIKQAVYNGRQTAQAVAEATGHRLGDVKSITVAGNSPSYAGMQLMSLRAAAKDEATPVEPGTNTLSESVEVVYYLQ